LSSPGGDTTSNAAEMRPVQSGLVSRRRFLRAGIGGLVLAAALLPGPTSALLSAAGKPITTTNPLIGVHTRLTDEVEEWKIASTLQSARNMGASWVVEYFPWAYGEPEPGVFRWEHSDLVVKYAVSQGLNVVARIDMVPPWARPADTSTQYMESDRYGDYADFVAAFAARYRGHIRYYVIWNEPNTSFEWGYRPPSPAEYVSLLRAVYPRLKAVDPDAQVLCAGMAPTLEHSQWAINDLDYIRAMYDAGASGYVDGVAVHAYGGRTPPDDPAALDRLNYARVTLVRQIMEREGDADKPIIITEAGWNDHPRWTRAVRPGQRVEYTVRAYEKAREEWPWVLAVNMWAFRLPRPAHNYNDYFTFVGTDFRPKPIYEAVRSYARPQG
jgi:polysaccharide biosynthesis protein PslG